MLFVTIKLDQVQQTVTNLCREAIRRHGSFQAAVKAAHTSQRTFRRWMSGGSLPEAHSLVALSHAAGIPLGFCALPSDGQEHTNRVLALTTQTNREGS